MQYPQRHEQRHQPRHQPQHQPRQSQPRWSRAWHWLIATLGLLLMALAGGEPAAAQPAPDSPAGSADTAFAVAGRVTTPAADGVSTVVVTATLSPAATLYLPLIQGVPAQPGAEQTAETSAAAAPLVVRAAGVYTTITDVEGSYVLPGLPAGTYALRAGRSGWTVAPTHITVTLTLTDVTANFTATTRTVDQSPMITIPAGAFMMGTPLSHPDHRTDEVLHSVELDAYAIDKYEVTNARYLACVAEGGCTPPHDVSSFTRTPYFGEPLYAAFPLVNVDWQQARAFCAWAGKRLPTEAEWEKAARGTGQREYPWGDAAPACNLANFRQNGAAANCVGDTTAVGSYPNGASLYGVLDMSGNVAEWVYDWYDHDYYESSPGSNPPGPAEGTARVVRGGSWGENRLFVRSARRHFDTPTDYTVNTGFRCAASQ